MVEKVHCRWRAHARAHTLWHKGTTAWIGIPSRKQPAERSWRMEETVRRRTALCRDGQHARPYQRYDVR